MAKKRNQLVDAAAATEAPENVAEEGQRTASADSATPRKASGRRGGGATAEEEASAAVHAPCPADSGKVATDREGKKPRLNKQKRKKRGQTPRASASDADAAATGKSGDDCTDGDGVPGDAEVSMSPRTEDDPNCPEVNIEGKGTAEMKKPKLRTKRRKKNTQASCVSNDNALEVHKSRTDCKDVPGGDKTVRNPRNEEDPGFSSIEIAEPEIQERKKKPRRRKQKNNSQEESPSAVADGDMVVVGNSGNDFTPGKAVPEVADVSMSSRNGEDQDFQEVHIAEKETPQRKKPKLKKPKENKHERSPSTVSDDAVVQSQKSGIACVDEDGASGDTQVCMGTRNVEDRYCPEVNIGENGTHKRKKPKPKKWKNKKVGSSSVILEAGAVIADESRNGCTDGDGAPQDIEPSICPRNDRYTVNNAEKGVREMCKPKRKKRKKNSQEQSPTALFVASDIVVDKSRHASTDVGDPSGGADVTMSPRIGEVPEYPILNATDDLLEGNKVNEDYSQKSKRKKQKKNKHEQSPAAPDTCAVVEDKSGKSYIDGKDLLGDTEISMSPRNGKDHDFSEVNTANELAEGKNGNNDNSQKPKNRRWKSKWRASVAVTETPPVGDVSSDERKDVCRTRSMKVTDKSVSTSATSVSGENHKENICDIYSPEGSLVRFQRKKLLILDLNGILADINTDSHVSHMADGRVRGKNVFKRDYLDDFLRFCFQNFELAIWSSRMKVNVDAVVDIIMKDLRRHLVFCWDLSKCTTTNCFTLENNKKPLVLKELKKLWNKEDRNLPWEQGEFSPSNTLLVDDSPYKALRNPPYTAIFPQSYTYHIKGDNSLGPGGDLRVYLENIAAADDVQRYVQDHPFGQPSITESDPHWDFYAKIHYRLDICADRKF